MLPVGRAVDLRAETDGDLHIELQDATGDKPGIVVVEVAEKPQWCENHWPGARIRFDFMH